MGEVKQPEHNDFSPCRLDLGVEESTMRTSVTHVQKFRGNCPTYTQDTYSLRRDAGNVFLPSIILSWAPSLLIAAGASSLRCKSLTYRKAGAGVT